MPADRGDQPGLQPGRYRHGLEHPRHIARIERAADPTSLADGPEQRALAVPRSVQSRTDGAHRVWRQIADATLAFLIRL